MANAYQCPLLYFFYLSFSKFHIWIASIKLSLKLNTSFVRRKLTKMANEMAATY